MEIKYSHKLAGLSQFIDELEDGDCLEVSALKEVTKTVNEIMFINDADQDSEIVNGIRDIAWAVFTEEL